MGRRNNHPGRRRPRRDGAAARRSARRRRLRAESPAAARAALALLKRQPFDLVITDLRMESVDGLDVLEAARAADPTTPVIIMTAFGAIESAVEAIKRGASHYLTKPFKLEEVLVYVERALAEQRAARRERALRRWAGERSGFGALIGKSAAMRELYRAARARGAVVGAGADHAARAAPARSWWRARCTSTGRARERAVRRGQLRRAPRDAARVGAVRPRARRLHRRHRRRGAGCSSRPTAARCFLDEIGDMPLPLQAKLLRVLEEGEVRAVGGDAARKVDVRIVAATHQDLEERVRAGQFREDLYYRLNVVPIARAAAARAPRRHPAARRALPGRGARAQPDVAGAHASSRAALATLARWTWPGNVRELENLVERLVIIGFDEVVQAADVKALAAGVGHGGAARRCQARPVDAQAARARVHHMGGRAMRRQQDQGRRGAGHRRVDHPPPRARRALSHTTLAFCQGARATAPSLLALRCGTTLAPWGGDASVPPGGLAGAGGAAVGDGAGAVDPPHVGARGGGARAGGGAAGHP